MREILFRGKRYNGEWEYGVPLISGEVAFITSLNSESKIVIPETIGQYTGLTDKNGKKIFEGDVLIAAWKTKIIIYYTKCGTQFRAREALNPALNHSIDYYDNDRMEIIGNIHDNPELLGGASNG